MGPRVREKLESRHAIKTYRYLRIGMVGAVVLLGASLLLEQREVDCWQTSISAYYYTPVRAIFVGAMMVIGFALIMVKGHSSVEDICLNVAGMLAPIVAIVPTKDLDGPKTGTGASAVQELPCRPSQLISGTDQIAADVVKAVVDNNFRALLIVGTVGLVVAMLIALVVNAPKGAVGTIERGTAVSLLVTGVALAGGWWATFNWDGLSTGAHGWAAVLMFVFLIVAVSVKAYEHRTNANKILMWLYAIVGVAMALGGILIYVVGGRYKTLLLEGWEIAWFAAFWAVQTGENWGEEVQASPGEPALSS